MLRITVQRDAHAVTLKLEGRLAGDWAEEAGKVWSELVAESEGNDRAVDVSNVSFVDEAGRHVLEGMHAAGARLIGSGPMMNDLIARIRLARPQRSHRTALNIVLLLAGVLVFGSRSRAEEATLTLDQAIAMATEQNRSLRTSALEAQKAEDRLSAARTHRLPALKLYALGAQQLRSFDFTLERGVLGNYPGTGPLPASDVKLKTPLAPTGILMGSVSQPLSTLFRIQRNLATLKTGVELAREQVRADRQQTVRNVKRLYYGLQQVESALRSVRQTAELYRELEKLTENYVAGAVVLKAELMQVQTRVIKTEESELSLSDQRATGKEQLNQLLGRDIATEFEVQNILDAREDELDLQAAGERALRQRPEIRQAVLRQRQAEQDARAKKAEYIPDVSADFNSLTLLNFGRFLPLQSNSVGLSVSWEPFDWGRKKQELAEKRRTIDQARNARQDAVNAVLIDVHENYRKLRRSRLQLRAAQLAQETALESLRVIKNKYAVQAVLLKNVLEGQVNLEQSNDEYRQALLTFWDSRADFERALGEDQ